MKEIKLFSLDDLNNLAPVTIEGLRRPDPDSTPVDIDAYAKAVSAANKPFVEDLENRQKARIAAGEATKPTDAQLGRLAARLELLL